MRDGWVDYDDCDPPSEGGYEIFLDIYDIMECPGGFGEKEKRHIIQIISFYDETEGFIHDKFGFNVTHWREIK